MKRTNLVQITVVSTRRLPFSSSSCSLPASLLSILSKFCFVLFYWTISTWHRFWLQANELQASPCLYLFWFHIPQRIGLVPLAHVAYRQDFVFTPNSRALCSGNKWGAWKRKKMLFQEWNKAGLLKDYKEDCELVMKIFRKYWMFKIKHNRDVDL